MATGERIKNCCKIIQENTDRRFIVVSAPGKGTVNSQKVTDLLYECYERRFQKEVFDESFAKIAEIFREIASIVEDFPIEEALQTIYIQAKNPEANVDFVVSRGEFLNAKIIAAYLNYTFLDAKEFIRFTNGELDICATIQLAEKIDKNERYVIPGFYGRDERGHIKTFSRGGSDITGSIVARVANCELYENWTDVDGISVCDPKIVHNPKKVSEVSFRELREMSYMGASVLHAETLLPIFEQPIPILLKNSFEPESAGTRICKTRTDATKKETITCITGKNDYSCIQISKMMLDKQLGFVKKVTSVFEEYNINISHTHSGLDNLCFFVENSEFTKISFQNLLSELISRIDADKIKGYEEIALLAVIGHDLSQKTEMLSKIFHAFSESGINVKTIYQSMSECNIILGVENSRLNESICALYKELVEEN